MTLAQIERHIAQHEARQLRNHPARHWGYIACETRAWRMLCRTHGRLVPVTSMTVKATVRTAA